VVTPSLIRAHLSEHTTPYTQEIKTFKHHKPKPLTKNHSFSTNNQQHHCKMTIKTTFFIKNNIKDQTLLQSAQTPNGK